MGYTGSNTAFLGVTINSTDLGTKTSNSPKNDGTNGIPRTADETRPTNVTMVWIIRIK